MRPMRNALFILLFGASCVGADSNVYSYTDKDGSVFLSNVPTDQRYALLIDERGNAARFPAAKGGRSLLVDSARHGAYREVVERTASLYGLDSALLQAVITVESGYNPVARSKKGAAGLMQLMPATAMRYGVADAFDPAQNIDGGARYIRDLIQMFDSDLSLVLAAYNAGENSVRRNQNQIPRIRETQEYVPKVLAHYKKLKASPLPGQVTSIQE